VRAPIEIGLPDLVCVTARLVVFGPDNVPAITDPAEAADDHVDALDVWLDRSFVAATASDLFA
jgi:hypothetical protein